MAEQCPSWGVIYEMMKETGAVHWAPVIPTLQTRTRMLQPAPWYFLARLSTGSHAILMPLLRDDRKESCPFGKIFRKSEFYIFIG